MVMFIMKLIGEKRNMFQTSLKFSARSLLQLIHRMIEFVIREGPMFEAMIMNKEISNPDFRVQHMFIIDGNYIQFFKESLRTNGVQNLLECLKNVNLHRRYLTNFLDGSIWKPPPVNPFLQGMPEELIRKEEEFDERNKKGSLSNAQRKRLESMIRTLTPEKDKVGEVMVWCIEHAEAAHEICQCFAEALVNIDTPLPKKVDC
ncbi:U2 snRNP-associated SURP motif-containing protein [Armadillidium nasatum]|uniref:U2 snRNP-associated SURP motif-containing protein n=1 Tax=Armadillidium nasatum TaxID=96803 RepID=A0A5N5TBU4_9CRUS|nr:U2 snRNP-associated SURP motif-containing protein [Armadillidium nasatum]